MTLPAPSKEAIAKIAEAFALDLTDADLESFIGLMVGTMASHDIIDELAKIHLSTTPPVRSSERPGAEDNPLGAWYQKTSIRSGEGPLSGRTIVIKDNVAVAGVPMMNGSKTLEGFVPSTDATVVSRVLEAGAEIVGKAVCEDLCFSGASHTAATGPIHNPWDTTRTTGGSSAGCAALLSSGQVDLAIGGDQGGSVRIPAGFCGVVGHKPTFGLVPYTGAFPIETTLDHLGPMATTVADAAALLDVLAGPDGNDPRQDSSQVGQGYVESLGKGIEGMRVGILSEGFAIEGASEPGVDDCVRAAAARLSEAGAVVSEVSIPLHAQGLHIWNVISIEGAASQMVNLNGYGMNSKGLYDPEMIKAFFEGRQSKANDLSETVKLVTLLGIYLTQTYGSVHYAKARNLEMVLCAAIDAALADFDVLVMPTLPMIAPTLAPSDASREDAVARALEMISNTSTFSVTGHPALSVPAGLSEGMPVGMMIVAAKGEDATALRVGHAFEQIVGGFPAAPEASSGATAPQS